MIPLKITVKDYNNMLHRRDFIRQLSAAGIISSMPGILLPQRATATPVKDTTKIWACLLHLSFNMWEEYISPRFPDRGYRPDFRVNEPLWRDALEKMAAAGLNMVVIDLGDAVKYESHPEIAVHGAWSVKRLREELQYIRRLGLEPIPKLNFSTGHDTWMGEYARMVSTEKYYSVCKDLIREVISIFDKPRFFHLGMDEETAKHQSTYNYIVVRQNDLWWHDFFFLAEQVEKGGVRPWIWSDYVWQHPEEFFNRMPKSVLQSNWYYKSAFDETQTYVKAYIDLEAHGYDQVPCASNFNDDQSMQGTVQFCSKRIANQRLYGFLQTVWKSTTEANREPILKGIALVGEAKKMYIQDHPL
ncbi:hypothetical protein [Chitinophaga sp.]|uniref:hypothetical protein n=1 Tax=Chitinophaga sp. TaxID=1869181 RepID=UPI002D7E1FC5|nr:hypothetical protein [Chitinophaga sp.]